LSPGSSTAWPRLQHHRFGCRAVPTLTSRITGKQALKSGPPHPSTWGIGKWLLRCKPFPLPQNLGLRIALDRSFSGNYLYLSIYIYM
jgi:hypothetical protein